ncbi:MAG: hypothetical protein ACRDDF_12505, partial [Aeromonas sp.]
MLQESWLHADIEDGIVQLDGFDTYRVDRHVKFRNRGGGVITYLHHEWCKSASTVYSYSTVKINCLVMECKPRFICGFRSIIVGNIYLAPDTSSTELDRFADLFSTALVLKLDYSLCIVAGDFNKMDTKFLTILGLSNLVNFPTRLNAPLDLIFTNCIQLFSIQKCAPLASSDHCVLKLCPTTYSRTNAHISSKRSSRTVKQRNCSTENLDKLRRLVASTDFSVFANENPSIHCEHLTDYLNFCFDQCCPVETIYLRTDRFSSPRLKQLRRKKEHAYKVGKNHEVKSLTKMITTEIRRLNKLYVDTVLGNTNGREMWRLLKQLCGKNSS